MKAAVVFFQPPVKFGWKTYDIVLEKTEKDSKTALVAIKKETASSTVDRKVAHQVLKCGEPAANLRADVAEDKHEA